MLFLSASLSCVNLMTFVGTHSQTYHPFASLPKHRIETNYGAKKYHPMKDRDKAVSSSPLCSLLTPLIDDSDALSPLLELGEPCLNPSVGYFSSLA